MCKTLIALCVAACAVTTAARATTFPTLTTIYVASGVTDNGVPANSGVATVVHCTNASGLSASLRFLVLLDSGGVAGAHTTSVAHGGTFTASTHNVATFIEDVLLSPGVFNEQGSLIVEATQSGIFCSAMIVSADTIAPSGIPLHLVRVNPHPGTVE